MCIHAHAHATAPVLRQVVGKGSEEEVGGREAAGLELAVYRRRRQHRVAGPVAYE
jgi:hypothetical protein